MYILTDKDNGGVYAVYNKDKIKTVQIFEVQDDAERYTMLLEAQGSKKLDVLKVNLDDVALNCGSFGYFYNVITSDDFVVPPT
jgi:hypothetical protein|tara:strand:- start:1451 stop:1699 length:249 start_codon:yes stop_codon:yes gene_type:complete